MALRSLQNTCHLFRIWSVRQCQASKVLVAKHMCSWSSHRVCLAKQQTSSAFSQTQNLIRLPPHPWQVHQTCAMSGHSKWQNIKNIKAAGDAKKAKNSEDFTRRARAIIREKGIADPKYNPQLARLLVEAKGKNIPSSTIERVLNQMSKLKDALPCVFEAKGPGGSIMLIEAMTLRPQLTRQELQSYVKKCGFSIFEGSSLAKMTFEQKGVVMVDLPGEGEATANVDEYVDLAIEVGAEEVTLEEDEEGRKFLQFLSAPNDVYTVKKAIEERKLAVRSAEVTFISLNNVGLGSKDIEQIGKVLDKLDDHPDVLKVYTNVVEAS